MLKIIRIGNSEGIVLPKSVLDQLQLRNGDIVCLTKSPDGFRLTPYGEDFAEQVSVAEGIMARYRNALRELAH
ncbi:MAG: AbrB/MazE/SpoVT family DNA-binding domain-containing protein [Candidatus Schekmanbacteria bacterium]|nr:AbrB/MazE/SpoVT family DNA-binding domain-containing protein [Candidatus Schekmanbacteria bacterium]